MSPAVKAYFADLAYTAAVIAVCYMGYEALVSLYDYLRGAM